MSWFFFQITEIQILKIVSAVNCIRNQVINKNKLTHVEFMAFCFGVARQPFNLEIKTNIEKFSCMDSIEFGMAKLHIN